VFSAVADREPCHSERSEESTLHCLRSFAALRMTESGFVWDATTLNTYLGEGRVRGKLLSFRFFADYRPTRIGIVAAAHGVPQDAVQRVLVCLVDIV